MSIVRTVGNPPKENETVWTTTMEFPGLTTVLRPGAEFGIRGDASDHLISGLPKGYTPDMMAYIRECNTLIRSKEGTDAYERGTTIRFTREGQDYTFVGSRWGYYVREGGSEGSPERRVREGI